MLVLRIESFWGGGSWTWNNMRPWIFEGGRAVYFVLICTWCTWTGVLCTCTRLELWYRLYERVNHPNGAAAFVENGKRVVEAALDCAWYGVDAQTKVVAAGAEGGVQVPWHCRGTGAPLWFPSTYYEPVWERKSKYFLWRKMISYSDN